tara:strand:- start:309 stop:623 length:315 start_codon:yes stop_codon:yes gene_type:complete
MTHKKPKKKQIDDLKRMLGELAEKVSQVNENLEEPSHEEKKPLEDDYEPKKSESDDMAEVYRAAYSFVYDALPHWKRQVIDDKLYDDRIYKDFTKEVIRNAEDK